jgi:hypothetical protein
VDTDTGGATGSGGWLRSPSTWVLLGFLGIAAFYLLAEHRAHVFGILPYLLFLLCPLLHLFMHGGHGGHDGRADPAAQAGGAGHHEQRGPAGGQR